MKKQLLSIFAALTVGTVSAQVPGPDWVTNQTAVFPGTAANSGVKFMDAVDANVVWVIGTDYAQPSRNYNWFSRSINGGATFAGGNVYGDTNTFVIANMEGIDANTAWVSAYKKSGPGGGTGGGGIHRTTDGGVTWVNMTASGMFTNTASFANWVTFLTPSVGIANGDPINNVYELWRTTDGGLTWNLIPSASIPAPANPGEFAIVNLYAKVGSSNLWFGTNGDRMFRSTDGGLTYSASNVSGVSTNTITEIAFSSPLNGICYEINASFAVELWNTNNGGSSWTQITPLPANLGLADIGNIPGTGNLASFGSGTGNEIISYSADNGFSWTDWGSTGIPYVTGDFVNGTTAWAGSLKFGSVTDVWKYTGAGVTGTLTPIAAFSLPGSLCLSGGSAVITPTNMSSGSPAVSYSWSVLPAGATLSSATANAPTITFASANTYTVVLTATNTLGSNTSSFVMNVTSCVAPTANFTIPTSACTNFTFAATNTSAGTPAPSYMWSISPSANVTLAPSPVASTPNFKATTAGIYTITLLTTNASGTAQTTQTVNVGPCGPNVNFSIPSSMSICVVNSFSTTNATTNPAGASGSITYTWSVAPSAGLSFFPNLFQQNLVVTINDIAIANYTNTVKQYTVTLRARNASATTTVTQVIDVDACTVGINENSLASNLAVFPNPAHDVINITLPSSTNAYKVKLTNILGSVVYEDKTSKDLSINLSNKPKGVYFLTVESNGEKATKKIVVE